METRLSSYALRRKKLRSLTKDNENLLVTKPQNLFYLTGFWGGGVGVVLDDRLVLVTSNMERRRAEKSAGETEVIGVSTNSGITGEVRKLLRRGSSVVDSGGLKINGRVTVDDGPYLQARRTKDREEQDKITTASRKIDRIYELLEREAMEGMTEREVAADVMRAATLEGLTPFGSEGSLSPIIVAAGENGAYPHAEVTDRVLRDGDFVVVDLFFRFEGYGSDETRTFGVGRLSKEKRQAYQAVLAAQKRGIQCSRAGVECRRVHAQVSRVLGRSSLLRYFTHGTGHGVGVDIHELPSISAASGDRLRENDVVTVEPGVYLPGKYGIRIEDTVLVGMREAVLTRYTRELVVL